MKAGAAPRRAEAARRVPGDCLVSRTASKLTSFVVSNDVQQIVLLPQATPSRPSVVSRRHPAGVSHSLSGDAENLNTQETPRYSK